jgi:hypothetical protein
VCSGNNGAVRRFHFNGCALDRLVRWETVKIDRKLASFSDGDQLKGIGSSFGTRSDADARGQRGRVVVVPFMRRKPTRAEKGDQGRA